MATCTSLMPYRVTVVKTTAVTLPSPKYAPSSRKLPWLSWSRTVSFTDQFVWSESAKVKPHHHRKIYEDLHYIWKTQFNTPDLHHFQNVDEKTFACIFWHFSVILDEMFHCYIPKSRACLVTSCAQWNSALALLCNTCQWRQAITNSSSIIPAVFGLCSNEHQSWIWQWQWWYSWMIFIR